MTLKEYIIEEHTIDDKLDKDWLEGGVYDGIGFYHQGEYDSFLEKWKDDECIKDSFREIIYSVILDGIKPIGGWAYTFFENLTIEKALEISKDIRVENIPWPTDFTYKGKSLCEGYGYPANISSRYKRVFKILDKTEKLICDTCEMAYRDYCKRLMEEEFGVIF